jgi:hypothetical protein
MNDILGKILRIVGIIFFGITTLINLLGGIGTTCAAFLTEQYPNYMALIDQGMQWLYQGLVITTVILALVGIWVLVQLIRRKENAFRNALIVLVIGTILAGIQFYYSTQLFGKAAPANMKFYFNVATLVLFLIYLIPGVRQRVNYSNKENGSDKETAGGLAAIILGVLLLTTPAWAGPSHTFQGENWVMLLQTELYLSGILLTGAGIAILARIIVNGLRQELALSKVNLPKDN